MILKRETHRDVMNVSGPGAALLSIRDALKLLSPSDRLWSVILAGLMMVSAFLESTVVALVLPLVYSMVEPNRLEKLPLVPDLLALFALEASAVLPSILSVLAVLLILAATLKVGILYFSEALVERGRNRLAHELLEKIVRVPYVWILRQKTAVLVKAIYDDVRHWRRDCIQSCLVILQNFTLIVFPATVAVLLAPSRGFIALLLVGAMGAAVIALVRRPIQSLSADSRINYTTMMGNLLQVLQGMREVKVSNRIAHFLKSFDKFHERANHTAFKAQMLANVPTTLLGLSGQLAFVLAGVFLWDSGLSGVEIAGHLTIIGVVVSRVLPAINAISSALSRLFRSLPHVEGLLSLMRNIRVDEGWLSAPKHAGLALPKDWQRVQLINVCAAYENDSIALKDISIDFERGKRYGVVGRSGAGKTTLVNVFLGLIEPIGGTILIDGKSRDLFCARGWLEMLAYVPQDVFLLDDTLKCNICFGTGDQIDEERFARALKLSGLETFTADLVEGREVQLGERGKRFSGGEAQRVAIARALYRAPSILLLDEATSALDTVTEGEIHRNILNFDSSILTIAVSHRVSSLKNYDVIIVLDDGKVVDSGNFAELFDRSQLFRDLAAESKRAVVA